MFECRGDDRNQGGSHKFAGKADCLQQNVQNSKFIISQGTSSKALYILGKALATSRGKIKGKPFFPDYPKQMEKK